MYLCYWKNRQQPEFIASYSFLRGKSITYIITLFWKDILPWDSRKTLQFSISSIVNKVWCPPWKIIMSLLSKKKASSSFVFQLPIEMWLLQWATARMINFHSRRSKMQSKISRILYRNSHVRFTYTFKAEEGLPGRLVCCVGGIFEMIYRDRHRLGVL